MLLVVSLFDEDNVADESSNSCNEYSSNEDEDTTNRSDNSKFEWVAPDELESVDCS